MVTRRAATLLSLLALIVLWCSVAAAGRASREITLFDGVRGAFLGTLEEDAPYVVLETEDGWRRIRLEAWIIDPATGEDTGPISPGPVSAGSASVQGVLAAPMGSGGGPGAGVVVLLVLQSDALDRGHRLAGEECRARLEKKDRDLEDLRAQVNRALNSSDNFREASARSDRSKARLAAGHQERLGLVHECRARALGVFEESATKRAISDASGRFGFEGIVPGRYRVVGFETSGDSPRSWSFDLTIEKGESRVLDPAADRSRVPADWGLR